ncbi:MAG: NADH:ubiquinone reductase (Na(+)-transporting) subunit D [Planctomycetota bacterium]|jgi:Na+-transporting NADH:ubiquinone oxidoreductase subunit D
MLTLKEGLWQSNPISIQILGVCSALAVTNRVSNALVMGAALVFVCAMSNLFVSLLRRATPRRIRMIAEVAIIATFVILFDQFLKAFYWDMSKQLGPYVGLIITNCIVMGRAEAFALQNGPLLSVVDGIANGLGYAAVLGIIGVLRELLGSGSILGVTVLAPEWYTTNQVMILAPGAFFGLGLVIAIFNAIKGPEPEEEAP